jgi:hypothetical protein
MPDNRDLDRIYLAIGKFQVNWSVFEEYKGSDTVYEQTRLSQYTMPGRLPLTINSSRLNCNGLSGSRV